MRLSQMLKAFNFKLLLKRVQQEATKHYERLLPILEGKGEWNRLETLQLNAHRIGIAVSGRLPLPPREGYRSLGKMAMHVIACRDHLRMTSGRLTDEDEQLAHECATKAEKYGWNHEAWKFHWILYRRGNHDRTFHLVAFWKYFCKVQLPLTARILQLFLN